MKKTQVLPSLAEPGYAPTERGLRRRDLFLDAAMKVFIERGYEATSLQEIVARAGGSLATLYRMFGNKEGLFHAVIERKAHTLFSENDATDIDNQEPETVLLNIGHRLIDLILSPDVIGMNRLIIAEAGKNPRLREIFLELAPNRMYRFLAEYFATCVEADRFLDIDPQLAAVQFVEMIRGDLYMRGLLGEALKISNKERQRIVRHAVDVFLYGMVKRSNVKN